MIPCMAPGACRDMAGADPEGSLLVLVTPDGQRRPVCFDHYEMASMAWPLLIRYRDYLQSDWWQSRRLVALELAGRRCQGCGATEALEVHHDSYAHLGAEPDEDLRVLCHDCHSAHHGRRP